MSAVSAVEAPLLEVEDLVVEFGPVRAVDRVSFTLPAGPYGLALVGESGSGKTTTARCIVRAVAPTSGEILLRTGAGKVADVATLPRRALRPLRTQVQMIFQDPRSSLNPRLTVADIVGGPIFFPLDGEVVSAYRDFIVDAPEELGALFAFTMAAPLPFVPEKWHGRPVSAVIACWSGTPGDGEEALAPIRTWGEVIGSYVDRMPNPALNSMFDALLPPGLQHYWKGNFARGLPDGAIEAHLKHAPGVPCIETGTFLYPMNGACRRVPYRWRDAGRSRCDRCPSEWRTFWAARLPAWPGTTSACPRRARRCLSRSRLAPPWSHRSRRAPCRHRACTPPPRPVCPAG